MTSAIPEGFVPLDYLMDPATEDVIPGSKLRDGMVVLLDETLLRLERELLEIKKSQEDQECGFTFSQESGTHLCEIVGAHANHQCCLDPCTFVWESDKPRDCDW